jgi:hypothetical protein
VRVAPDTDAVRVSVIVAVSLAAVSVSVAEPTTVSVRVPVPLPETDSVTLKWWVAVRVTVRPRSVELTSSEGVTVGGGVIVSVLVSVPATVARESVSVTDHVARVTRPDEFVCDALARTLIDTESEADSDCVARPADAVSDRPADGEGDGDSVPRVLLRDQERDSSADAVLEGGEMVPLVLIFSVSESVTDLPGAVAVAEGDGTLFVCVSVEE